MVHGSWCSTFDGVGALLFDVLPITIGAAPLGQCHNLPLMTKMFLCGGACLYTAVTSSKIARESLPSNGTSANPNLQGWNRTLVGSTSVIRRHREPWVRLLLMVHPARWPMPSEGIEGNEWGAYVVLARSSVTEHGMACRTRVPRSRSANSTRGRTPHQGARESRAQGEVAQVAACPESVRYARCGRPKQDWS
jgi:hypothetical protein